MTRRSQPLISPLAGIVGRWMTPWVSARTLFAVGFGLSAINDLAAMRVLNFQADNGFQHESKKAALSMVESLGDEQGWVVVTTVESSSLTKLDLGSFDVVVFNNNCGNRGQVMSPDEQQALQQFVRRGGGFVGIHCAGAIWKEGGEFQTWYEGLIGARMVDHPAVQEAHLVVEDRTHGATSHLPPKWVITDEWHRFGSNPREKVHVLISVDEDSYEGKQKMGGDHPAVWYHDYDGGRAFFSTIGHTVKAYHDPNYQKLIMGAINWAGAGKGSRDTLPVKAELLLDLDADQGDEIEDGNR